MKSKRYGMIEVYARDRPGGDVKCAANRKRSLNAAGIEHLDHDNPAGIRFRISDKGRLATKIG